uniref:Zonadhesin-like n=1 Tax=Saccoglossus kowalevskii TaxID=10224 RepID=A0ABM0LXI9_SACKO|nr:PREDICTED: zonadhesin-like [Saccoglossus kowalevskii]
MERAISNVVKVFLFSACLTSVLAASLEGKESPVSDTESRLDSFFHGLYQRQALQSQCNVNDPCKSSMLYKGSTVTSHGECGQQCDITKDLQMNNNLNLCNKVSKCGCKCCIRSNIGKSLEAIGYQCIADDAKEHKLEGGQSQGDPHLTTFDGLNYTHTGQNCTYVLFKECKRYPSFVVATKYTGFIDRRERIHSQVSDVLIKVKHTLIQLGQGSEIYVNGKPITVLPWTDGGTITIRNRDNRHVSVNVENKFTVSWTGFGNIASKLDSSLDGAVCGLLGNADGDPKNDLQMEDGTLVGIEDAEKFGNSWMIPGSCKTEVTKDEIKFIQQ